MNGFLKRTVLFIFLFHGFQLFASDTTYTCWRFNSLSEINGISVTTSGNPVIIGVNSHSAFLFDGNDDMVTIPDNPLIGLDEFTLEVIFRVDRGGLSEQKFFHMQANPDIRILFELEFTNDSML